MSENKIAVRAAVLGDLPGIMKVESEAWGDGVSEDAAASEQTMRSRIELFAAAGPPGWFFVVESDRGIEGHVIFQPTAIAPEECRGWDHATDEGRLAATFDLKGPYINGVALAMRHGAPPFAADLLMAAGHSVRLAMGKDILYLCARMPGFAKAHRDSGISADEYWQLRRRDGLPKDPLLLHFLEMMGVYPERLLVNGYPPDEDSGGHGVLCVSRDPMKCIVRSAARLAKFNFSMEE